MRYIISKEAALYISINSNKLATDELAKDIVITNEILTFNNLPFVSVILTDEQVLILKENGFDVKEEGVQQNGLLAGNYEKVRARYYKAQKKNITGKGCKIAILDTGLATSIIPVEFAVNLATAAPGVTGNPSHGTFVTSIIKDSLIGLAKDAEVHFLKVWDDSSNMTESTFLAAMDYCIDNEIDIVNMSFAVYFPNMEVAIQECINAGIVMCAASGNETSVDVPVLQPALFSGVVSVSALSEDKSVYTKNILILPGMPPGAHGPTVACSGITCEGRFYNGVYGTSSGTSFSCPFFVGTFACHYEQLGSTDNYEVLNCVFNRMKKDTNSVYFGRGLLTY